MSFSRIGLAVIALVAAVVAVYAVFQAFDARTAPPIVIEDAAGVLPVIVDVRGAVVDAGVYELPPGARMQDAVSAAGGLGENADLSTINLARRLRDGEVIVVPPLPLAGGTPAPTTEFDRAAAAGAGSGQRINLNSATVEELDVLPGIGEVTAERIVQFREENGPYRSVDDLIHVQGISDRTIDEFRDQVSVGP